MNIIVPSIPAKFRITQTLIEDALCDPVAPAEYIFNEKLDAFQRTRLKLCWWTPRVMDSSGFSSAKTKNMWLVSVMRALMFPDHVGAVYYQNFSNGQIVYWGYFNETAARAPVFRYHVGRNRLVGVDTSESEKTKAVGKGPSCWTCDFKNGSKILMPAPGFLTDAKSQAGLRFNDLFIDEWTKIEATGTTGIDDQLIGRTTRHCFNKNHPLFCNHHLFLATAEDASHPGYSRFRAYEQRVAAGDPDYYVFSFSYKDYSSLEFKNGVSFKDTFREERAINDMRQRKSRNGFLQEAFGIWTRNGRGWYSGDLIMRGLMLGRQWGSNIVMHRAEDSNSENVHYFGGIDPAKADTAQAADGAIITLRVEQTDPRFPRDLAGYKPSWCHGHIVRGADASQWSGIIHRLHQRFRYTKLCMDPGGGGLWIYPELRKPKQMIRGVETKVRPIGTLEDEKSIMVDGDFILMLYRLSDSLIQRVWEHMALRQLDNLNDTAHVELQEGFRHGIGIPLPYQKRGREEIEAWSEERQWANRYIDQMVRQLLNINVMTNPDGTIVTTKWGARMFAARGRKDLAMSGLMAWMAFLAWMRTQDEHDPDREGEMVTTYEC